MSNSRIERQANLTRLTQEVVTHAQQLGVPCEPSPLAIKLSEGLFLAHSTMDENFVKICADQHLLSKANRGVALKEDCDEVVLGTTNDVFFYVAPFRYPKSSCGLLFSQTLEEQHNKSGIATSFDSGGLRRDITRSNPAEPLNDFLTRHEMPIPEHRQYLGQGMTALFNQPSDYVDGTAPFHSSPVGLTGGDQRRWTHEVRIPGSVQVLGSPHLQAVFAA